MSHGDDEEEGLESSCIQTSLSGCVCVVCALAYMMRLGTGFPLDSVRRVLLADLLWFC